MDHGAPVPEMTAESAVALLRALGDAGVDARVGGGWAVDALVGRQTREHEDLDLWVPAEHADRLVATLAERGLDRISPWPGNRPWNFPLHGGRHRVDLHFVEQADADQWHYGAFTGGHLFPTVALEGRGTIGGHPVRCDHPEWSLRWHTGYPLRDKDRHDVALLCRHFGLPVPDGHS